MALASMTGFARSDGHHGAARWTWELRSVNGKGLDLRMRLANGFERLEPIVREKVRAAFARGSITANLVVASERAAQAPRINEDVCLALFDNATALAGRLGTAAPSLDTILTLKGVVEYVEIEDETDQEALDAALVASLETCVDQLRTARLTEGAAVGAIVTGHVDEIARLTQEAEDNPVRQPEAIAARLADQIAALLGSGADLDPQRLHQEAAVLATKVDIREELDRLVAHVGAARSLLSGGGPVGRKLDFLAQEFNRETNTLCSKSNDVALTRTGLALKAVVDQMREQIQNLE